MSVYRVTGKFISAFGKVDVEAFWGIKCYTTGLCVYTEKRSFIIYLSLYVSHNSQLYTKLLRVFIRHKQ